MGRYSGRLAPIFADFAGVGADQRVLDVGCGPGALTGELVARVGEANITAVDPSASFVEAVAARYPGVEAAQASAEGLPFEDDRFDAALAQLVVHFMTDPVAGLGEMRRVTRSGGVIAACVWDHAGGEGPLAVFWHAVSDIDPGHPGEADLPGTRKGHLSELFAEAGLDEVVAGELVVEFEHASFDEWWEPFTLGVGPAGGYVAGLDASKREELLIRCRQLIPSEPFRVRAVAWAARARVP
jgi:SAM-dependent methyltransferase